MLSRSRTLFIAAAGTIAGMGLPGCAGNEDPFGSTVSMVEPQDTGPTLPAVESSGPPANLSDADRARLAGLYDPGYVKQQPTPQPPPPQAQPVVQPPPAPTVCQPCQHFDGRLWYVNSRIANLERSNASLRVNADLSNPAIQNAIAQDEGRIAELKEQKAQLEAEKAACEKQCAPAPAAGAQPVPAPAATTSISTTPASQPVVQQQAGQAQANNQAAVWNFYCDSPPGYYGIVPACNSNWRTVPATWSSQALRYSYHCDDPPGDYPAVTACNRDWRWLGLPPLSPLATPVALEPETPAPVPIPAIVPAFRFNFGGGRSDR